jgi:hypothetical protein
VCGNWMGSAAAAERQLGSATRNGPQDMRLRVCSLLACCLTHPYRGATAPDPHWEVRGRRRGAPPPALDQIHRRQQATPLPSKTQDARQAVAAAQGAAPSRTPKAFVQLICPSFNSFVGLTPDSKSLCRGAGQKKSTDPPPPPPHALAKFQTYLPTYRLLFLICFSTFSGVSL